MKTDKGQITLIMIIAAIAALSIITATTSNTSSTTRTLAVIKNSQEAYEEALFINDYICGKFQEYIATSKKRSKNLYTGQNNYKDKITTFFNEAITIINNKCNTETKNTTSPANVNVSYYDSISGYYQHWFYNTYNYTKIIRYEYTFEINGKYKKAIMEIGMVKVSQKKGENSNDKNAVYYPSYATSFIVNPGGV